MLKNHTRTTLYVCFLFYVKVVSLLAKVVEHLVTGETMQMTTTSDQRCRYAACLAYGFYVVLLFS